MPIHGGKAIANVDLGYQGDDTGENISAKNPNYCELTTLYWAWKNLKSVDYIGLNHYRRYFYFSNSPFAFGGICSTEQFLKMGKTTFDLNKHLGNNDIILVKPMIASNQNSTEYSKCHNSGDYRILKKIIYDLFPDYAPSFSNILEYSNKCSAYNMFITRWEVFDNYCKWLFAVLGEVEKSINTAHYSVHEARVFGFLAEPLLNVYVLKNKLKVKHYPVVTIGSDEDKKSVFQLMFWKCKMNLSFLLSRPLMKKGRS
jgi:hypothetical protein